MKKILCVALILCLMLAVTACSAGDQPETDTSVAQTTDETGDEGTIEVDENLLTVDITLPASYFQDTTEEDTIAGAKEKGFKNVTVHEDGSVTYTVTKAQRQDILDGFKADVDAGLDDMLNGEDAVVSFQEISYNENMTEFTVKVDPGSYSEWDAMYGLVFYVYGMYYQAFDGVAPADNHVVVNFVDMNTGEVLNTGDSADMGE
ncbi:MAG: hypothetical protein Q7J82_01125 [Coriobacteriia bacterium]|nr:hypothetical protein [Coriobacteriia bacterium]